MSSSRRGKGLIRWSAHCDALSSPDLLGPSHSFRVSSRHIGLLSLKLASLGILLDRRALCGDNVGRRQALSDIYVCLGGPRYG